jgi:hypothetical protein
VIERLSSRREDDKTHDYHLDSLSIQVGKKLLKELPPFVDYVHEALKKIKT